MSTAFIGWHADLLDWKPVKHKKGGCIACTLFMGISTITPIIKNFTKSLLRINQFLLFDQVKTTQDHHSQISLQFVEIEILEPELVCWFCKFFWVKNLLISNLEKVIYFKGTIFHGSIKPLFRARNRMEIS
jgi:hypothetical protein